MADRVRVNRIDLLKALQAVQPGLALGDTIAQSACFVFRNGRVITFNDEVACRFRTPLPKEFTGAVQSRQIVQTLELFKDDEDVDVEITADRFIIRGRGRKEVGVRLEADILLPYEVVERPENSAWKDLPQEFSEALKLVQEAAGRKVEEFLTVCVHVHPDWLEACDRLQVTRYRLKTGAKEPFLVRKSSIQHIVPLGMTEFAETESWVHFANPAGLIFSCRRYTEPFMDVTPLLDFRGERIVLPRGLDEATKIGEVFTSEDKDNNRVLVQLRDEEMIVRGEGTSGYAVVPVPCKYRGPAMEFRVSPALLRKLVELHNEGELGETKFGHRLRIDGEKWTYLTSLGTSDKPKPKEKERKKAKDEAPAERNGDHRAGDHEREPAGRRDEYDREIPY